MKKCLFALTLLLAFIPNVARADVSLLVLEAMGGAGEFTGSGHTAIYFSNICADGPTRLRLCQPGERGAVISSYPAFGKGNQQEWIAVPLIAYLYGVEDERDIPLYANGKVRSFLRDAYRKKHLGSIVTDNGDGTMPEGRWRAMLTVAFNRDVYSFNIKTTIEEDREFLDEFNRSPDKGKFNSFTSNCADFTRKIINRYFPGAARRDVINDFGITTPKATAKSLTGYASNRPERLFNVTRYPQVAGSIWRSYDNRNFTEHAFTSKKYLVPSLVFYPYLAAVFPATYFTTGRFSVHQTYKEYASSEIATLNLNRSNLREAEIARHTKATMREEIEERKKADRLRIFGSRQIWGAYRANLAPVLKNAIAQGFFVDQREVRSFFSDLALQSEPGLDAEGAAILRVKYYGEERTLGLTRQNILSESSDKELAYKLLLAKIYADLNARDKDRSSLAEFRDNWEMMRQLSAGFALSSESRAR